MTHWESLLFLAMWLCSLLGTSASGVTQVAKMTENHMGFYWVIGPYHFSVSVVSAGRATR